MAASSGRKGRPWRRLCAQILAISTVCHLCGHEGAGDIDHVIDKATWKAMGGDLEDPANLRPAHGAFSRCPTCGRCCNQAKGNRPHVVTAPGSRDW